MIRALISQSAGLRREFLNRLLISYDRPSRWFFERLAIARHRIAKDKVPHRSKQIRFDAKSSPARFGEGDFDGRQKIKKSDNDDERSVFEKADEGVDQRRDGDSQRLRQNDVAVALPITQSKGLSGLILLARNSLKASPHDFGKVGGGKQDHRQLRS